MTPPDQWTNGKGPGDQDRALDKCKRCGRWERVYRPELREGNKKYTNLRCKPFQSFLASPANNRDSIKQAGGNAQEREARLNGESTGSYLTRFFREAEGKNFGRVDAATLYQPRNSCHDDLRDRPYLVSRKQSAPRCAIPVQRRTWQLGRRGGTCTEGLRIAA